jgi:hypothetical protein
VIRLFVGTGARNEDCEAQAVLEYTARKHCSIPLEITWMRQSATDPVWGGWNAASWRTPFTGYRWGVPAACGFTGRAIYTDVDFFFLGDLAELWTQEIPDPLVLLMKKPDGKLKNSSAILFDNAKCKAHIPALADLKRRRDAHDDCLHYFRPRRHLIGSFAGGDWNCSAFEKMPAPVTGVPKLDGVKAYHFTRIETQLHLPHARKRLKAEGQKHWYTGEVFEHPHAGLRELYDGLLAEAVANGYPPEKYRVQAFDGAKRKDFKYSEHVGASAC